MAPLVARSEPLLDDVLGPLGVPSSLPAFASFSVRSALPASALARMLFQGPRARALFAGLAAHSMVPLTRLPTASYGLVLALVAHVAGWPLARGGSQRVADGLASYLRSLGGKVDTARRIESLSELGDARPVLLDVTPRALLSLAPGLPDRYRRRLARFSYGPGVFKLDWALEAPIPWRAPECSRAATLHLGGTLEEIVASEREPWRGRTAERPFVLAAQQSLFDPSRAPEGRQTAWAYCHVPNGSTVDMTERIEAQVERFAPGFRDLILARSALGPAALEAHNPNYVGGDINGGASDLRQTLARTPYATPLPGVFLCSASLGSIR
jgi:phytoene dehydrogenase-like protein